jgi:hypothetical protein
MRQLPHHPCGARGALSEPQVTTHHRRRLSSALTLSSVSPTDRSTATTLLQTFVQEGYKRTHVHTLEFWVRFPNRKNCRYGEAPAAAASWRAHDGRRQRGTACPHLYRYRLTHTYCSLTRLPPTHPQKCVGAPILQLHFQVQWRARLPPPSVLLPHTCTQDGWFLQPKRRPAWIPRRTVPSNCICKCSRMRVCLSPPIVLLPHTCTQDGWFLQPKRRQALLPRRTVPSNFICRMRARLSPPIVLLPHTCTQDGWFLQPKRRPVRLPRRTVPSNCICRCSRIRACLSPPIVLLPHTCTQNGWFLQPKRLPVRLPRRTVPSNCICRCSRVRPPPPTHTPPPHTGFPMIAHLSRLRGTLA